MFNQQKDWIYYSSYWGKYNRVLLRRGGEFREQVEIDLTPINPDIRFGWDELKLVEVRYHTTHTDPFNYSHHLPETIFREMEKRVGSELAEFIFNADIFDRINNNRCFERRALYESLGFGGGVPLYVINPCFDFLKSYWVDSEDAIKLRIMNKCDCTMESVNDLSFLDILNERSKGKRHA